MNALAQYEDFDNYEKVVSFEDYTDRVEGYQEETEYMHADRTSRKKSRTKRGLDREKILLLGVLSLTFGMAISCCILALFGFEVSAVDKGNLATMMLSISGVFWCISLLRNC